MKRLANFLSNLLEKFLQFINFKNEKKNINEKNLIIIKPTTAENAIWKRVVHSKHLWKHCLVLLWAQSLLPGDCRAIFLYAFTNCSSGYIIRKISTFNVV